MYSAISSNAANVVRVFWSRITFLISPRQAKSPALPEAISGSTQIVMTKVTVLDSSDLNLAPFLPANCTRHQDTGNNISLRLKYGRIKRRTWGVLPGDLCVVLRHEKPVNKFRGAHHALVQMYQILLHLLQLGHQLQ